MTDIIHRNLTPNPQQWQAFCGTFDQFQQREAFNSSGDDYLPGAGIFSVPEVTATTGISPGGPDSEKWVRYLIGRRVFHNVRDVQPRFHLEFYVRETKL